MPKSSKAKLAYQHSYNQRPEEKAKGVERRRNRRHAIAAGIVSKGDGIDLDHKKPLDAGGTNAKSNIRPLDEHTNRGWRKRQPGMYGKK